MPAKSNITKKAMIIEEYVNNPDISPKEVNEKFSVSLQTFSAITSLWFTYKGLDPEILTLSSKV